MESGMILGFLYMHLLVLQISQCVNTKILEVTQDTFQTLTKDKMAIFLYVEGEGRGDCIDCKMLYPKFATAAQTFEDRDQILFGRVSDKNLIDIFEVDSFPEIVYYEEGSAVPRRYRGDITAATVENLIARVIGVKPDKLKRHYSVELTEENFDEIMTNYKQYRLVMLHKHDDEDDVKNYEELAKTYDNEKGITVARIDIDKHKSIRTNFGSIQFPSFYWYSNEKNSKRMRYEGKLDVKQMVHYVNKQTGFQRLLGGALGHRAGLIKEMDEIVKRHIGDIYEIKHLNTLIKKLQKVVANLDDDIKELGEYYIHLIEEIKEDKTVDTLDEARNRLFRAMDDSSPVRKDLLWKKTNIANRFIDFIGEFIIGDMGSLGENIGSHFDIDDKIVKKFSIDDGDIQSNSGEDPDSNKNLIVFREEL